MNDMRRSLLNNINQLNMTNNELDKRVYELSLLNVLNQELNYLKDYKQVFRIILKHLTAACQSERASVMIIENDELIVVEANRESEFVQIRPPARLMLENSAAGTALKKEKTVVVRNAEKSNLFKRHENNSYVKNILCIPFNVRENIKGVFNIVNRKRAWNKDNAQIAQLIINQGLIAIDNARLYELAITDGLTGLYIHRYFQVRLSEEIAKSKRFEKKVSLAMIDIDHFKKFNDTFGHQTGDQVLKIVSNIVRENIRAEIDIAARYGGEEFAIIMPDTDSVGSVVTADRLRKAMEEYDFKVEGKKVAITISIGVSTYPDHAKKPVDLILAADNALYV
ncbi:MAG: hypothetical protein C0601_06015 [Candidatus Muiribacterium halophilum]|uniref:GGDEF domain-containing protein n=1 Tax=Muiribacterium halophilum TaxID=2053465 RepID=A0A2N5ZH39_MUIH1|nr:MAG: hypothetical protein C0601_06015 [Candidatus Muirbacterium halophilum]